MNKKLKICIVGPGMMPIPPLGWGAIEILVWDYYQKLKELGHDVHIVNTPDSNAIIELINMIDPDFVHIQYDDYHGVGDRIKCDNVAITSHYAYLDQPNRHGGYSHTFHSFLRMKKARIFALSESIAQQYINHGFPKERIVIAPNGVRDDLFVFNEVCENPEKSIYLAKIDFRKRQHLFEGIPNLYFAGNIADPRFQRKNYLNEWDKPHLYQNLTRFANLVLLSDGEAHPLVCLEGMAAGLGLVISEFATANLDLSQPFIDVIPESKINDLDFISQTIAENRVKSIEMRKEIRQYVSENFSWNKIVERYIDKI